MANCHMFICMKYVKRKKSDIMPVLTKRFINCWKCDVISYPILMQKVPIKGHIEFCYQDIFNESDFT